MQETMTQDEKWISRYNEVVAFIESNKRNPSKYDGAEREIRNWIKHQRKLLNARMLKPERVERFRALMALMEVHRHKNQYQ